MIVINQYYSQLYIHICIHNTVMHIHIYTHWLAMYMLLHIVINHMIEDGLTSNETVINSASCVVRPTEEQTSVLPITHSCSVQVLPTTVTRRVLIPILTTSFITRISFVIIILQLLNHLVVDLISSRPVLHHHPVILLL